LQTISLHYIKDDAMTINDKYLKDVLTKAIRNIAPEAKVILYGSRARGTAKEDSDWDILIILDKDSIHPDDFDNISYPVYELGWKYGMHFSTKIYTSKEWEKRSFTPFYKNIEKEGVLL
jgi:uncharacterized protein